MSLTIREYSLLLCILLYRLASESILTAENRRWHRRWGLGYQRNCLW